MDKKADTKYLSLWWFLIIAIIGLGIVGGVIIFYSKDVNVKSLEADILAKRVVDCLNKGGKLINDFGDEGFNLFKECKLNQQLIDESGMFYLEITTLFKVDEQEAKKPIKFGKPDLKKQCEISEAGVSFTKSSYVSGCSEEVLFIENYKIRIFAASNQQGVKEREA